MNQSLHWQIVGNPKKDVKCLIFSITDFASKVFFQKPIPSKFSVISSKMLQIQGLFLFCHEQFTSLHFCFICTLHPPRICTWSTWMKRSHSEPGHFCSNSCHTSTLDGRQGFYMGFTVDSCEGYQFSEVPFIKRNGIIDTHCEPGVWNPPKDTHIFFLPKRDFQILPCKWAVCEGSMWGYPHAKNSLS